MEGEGADIEWSALFPGEGIVYTGSTPDIPRVPSVFYQLRCLDIVRKEIVALEALGAPHPAYPTDLGDHCINYLRQMALCRADTDMDVVIGPVGNLNIYPNMHVCRDWSVLYGELANDQVVLRG